MSVLDGKQLAGKIKQSIHEEILDLKKRIGRSPGLAVVLVGENPAAKIYVNAKKKTAEALGIHSRLYHFPDTISQSELLNQIRSLNETAEIDAILVQLPLPVHIDAWDIIEEIDPAKDVDALHPLNQGRMMMNRRDFYPCTPAGILRLLDEYRIQLPGMNAVVIGRSLLVGKPLSLMLTNRHATVTLCHSRTRDLAEILRRADLVIAAAGQPSLVTETMVREGVVLVDVGTNHIDNEEDCRRFCSSDKWEKFQKNGSVLTGDVHFGAYEKASYYSPVPGGVGPMTVTMLMANTLTLYKNNTRFG